MTTHKKTSSVPQQTENSVPFVPQASTTATDFQRYLREQARAIMRTFLEGVMREELDALIGVDSGQRSPERQGYRNGYYSRDLGTPNGVISDLKVPRDRSGEFHTQVFENYHRYEPQVEQGLTEMFVAGASTTKVGAVAQTLMGVAPSKSAVSRLNANLVEQFEQWRSRPLKHH